MNNAFSLLTLLVISTLVAMTGDCKAQETLRWERVTDDLEISEATSNTGRFFRGSLALVRTSLRRFDLRVVTASSFKGPKATVKDLCTRSNAVLCINANFFDTEGKPLGLIVNRGILKQPLHKGGNVLTGALVLTRNKLSIITRGEFNPENAIEAIQAGPRLLSGGTPISNIRDVKTPTRRSGVCIDQNQKVVFYATSSALAGLSIEEVQEILLRPSIGCVDALNLDGGGSAQMFLNVRKDMRPTSTTQIHIVGEDEVPVILALFDNRASSEHD